MYMIRYAQKAHGIPVNKGESQITVLFFGSCESRAGSNPCLSAIPFSFNLDGNSTSLPLHGYSLCRRENSMETATSGRKEQIPTIHLKLRSLLRLKNSGLPEVLIP